VRPQTVGWITDNPHYAAPATIAEAPFGLRFCLQEHIRTISCKRQIVKDKKGQKLGF
jgi:hypothetical protein